jgi:hypothetical protein
MGFPLLQKPTEMCVGRQIKVLGSYWKGNMSNEESNSLYLCTVRDYHELHSGIQVVHPLNQWSFRRWAWMDRASEKPEDPLPIAYFL